MRGASVSATSARSERQSRAAPRTAPTCLGPGLDSELEPWEGAEKNKKDPETEESTGGWRTGSEPGQEVRGYVNTKKAPQGGGLVAALLGNEVDSSWAS